MSHTWGDTEAVKWSLRSEQNLGQTCLKTPVIGFLCSGVSQQASWFCHRILPHYGEMYFNTNGHRCQSMNRCQTWGGRLLIPADALPSPPSLTGKTGTGPEVWVAGCVSPSFAMQAETSGGCDRAPPPTFYLAALLTAAVSKRSQTSAEFHFGREGKRGFEYGWRVPVRSTSLCPPSAWETDPAPSEGRSTSAHLLPNDVKGLIRSAKVWNGFLS